jgi:hypothetical protein
MPGDRGRRVASLLPLVRLGRVVSACRCLFNNVAGARLEDRRGFVGLSGLDCLLDDEVLVGSHDCLRQHERLSLEPNAKHSALGGSRYSRAKMG